MSFVPIPCSVYVIGFALEEGPSKIGIAQQPNSRLSNLQTAHHQRLILAGYFETPDREIARELELSFHSTQKAHRLSGEWFDMPPSRAMVTLRIGMGVMLNVKGGFEPAEVDAILKRSHHGFGKAAFDG